MPRDKNVYVVKFTAKLERGVKFLTNALDLITISNDTCCLFVFSCTFFGLVAVILLFHKYGCLFVYEIFTADRNNNVIEPSAVYLP